MTDASFSGGKKKKKYCPISYQTVLGEIYFGYEQRPAAYKEIIQYINYIAVQSEATTLQRYINVIHKTQFVSQLQQLQLIKLWLNEMTHSVLINFFIGEFPPTFPAK